MTARISKFGHIGLHVSDLEAAKSFYGGVLGLAETDKDPKSGATFFSSNPEEEHHELLIAPGRDAKTGAVLLQQVSFRCDSLEDVVEFYGRLRDAGVEIEQVVTHGNAVGVYFFDPDRNRCEVYWDTGLKAKQPFKVAIDLDRPIDAIKQEVEDLVAQYGDTGVRLA